MTLRLVLLLAVLGAAELVTSALTSKLKDRLKDYYSETPVDTGCFANNGGVCVPMADWIKCPNKDDLVTWKGCSFKSMCCYRARKTTPPFVRPTTPPPHRGACGISYYNGSAKFKVVGGWEAKKGEWPWLAAIVRTENSGHECGGALISDRWIVTAAHCFMNDGNKDSYHVVMGEFERLIKEPEEQRFDIERLIVHANFSTSTKAHDIALLKLDKPVKYTAHAQRICLPDRGAVFEGEICTIVGWGTTSPMGTEHSRLPLEVNLPLWTHDACAPKFGNFFDTQICAGFEHGMQDACGGDSGGPLMCQQYGTQLWHLAGVVSWGMGCALPYSPGVYTKVTSYLDWIQANAV